MKKIIKVSCPAILLAIVIFSGCRIGTSEGGDIVEIGEKKAWLSDSSNISGISSGNVEEAVIYSGEKYAVMNIKDYGTITFKLYPEFAPEAVENFISLAESGFYNGKNFHRVMKDFMIQGGSKNGDGNTDADGPSFMIEVDPKMRHFYGALCMAKNGLGECGSQFYIVNSKQKSAFSDIKSQISGIEAELPGLKAIYDNALSSGNEEEIKYYENQYKYYLTLIDFVKNSDDGVIDRYSSSGGVPALDGGYTVFGQAVEGFDVIDRVSDIPVDYSQSGEASVPRTPVLIDTVKILTNE
ncbi:MAG: peptidylprolyl isomerase [Eubacterium sp.]|jgi:peptidyl-prolyl cis-trans isomerase A (cyclophilin A)/peptidyl-prolyl cis-trans isomerase B (cyclophilin B)|nr:peptidylprolyl isomerase [Eubacterium sp.]